MSSAALVSQACTVVAVSAASRQHRIKRVVVVGGGVGGLSTAGRLAATGGYDVTVLEKNSQVGGRLQSFTQDGFRFDSGPSLLLFKDKYEEAFRAVGAELEDYTRVRRVEPAAYRLFFGSDSSSLDLLYDVQAMFQQLEGVEAGAGGKYLEFLAESRAALELGTKNFIERDFDSISDFLDLSKVLPLLRRVSVAELLAPHASRMARRFKDPRIRAMFTFQDLYVGLSPYTAPGVFSLLAATELTDGVWYPEGGFGTVRDGLMDAAQKNGVRIECGAEVSGICEDGGRVTGVTLKDGRVVPADIVVCNRDVSKSYELLATEHGRKEADRTARLEYSAGVVSFNWCMDRQLPRLQHHNIFLSDQYEKSWRRATSKESMLKKPNFYVHVPSRTDPTAAPEGKDSVMVLLPVANMQERGGDKDYSDIVEGGREAVLATMESHGVSGVRDAIACETVIDPQEWEERYGLRHGAAFGLSHGLTQLAVFRPGFSDPAVRGLYFCGASARPGNGVPLVLIGSKLAAEKIRGDVEAGLV